MYEGLGREVGSHASIGLRLSDSVVLKHFTYSL